MTAVAAPAGARAANVVIADRLDEVAMLLEQQRANPFRVRAYRNAAASLRTHPVPMARVHAEEGLAGLERIPEVGESIARAVRDLVVLGHLPMLERLRGESDPVELLASVPGIGPALAERLHHELGLATLEELEQAAHDGRLTKVAGFGPRRIAAVTASTAARLGRVSQAADRAELLPAVGELLDVDREYREGAKAGRLAMITPRRFNPEGRAWLPVLHTTRGDRHYTALFSNTALAHRLGRTRDWVVIYSDGARHEHQATVVTPRSGPLAGRRVVRGREPECVEYIAAQRGREGPRGARP
jgi:hypothetical protein